MPLNVTAISVNSTSILVTWEQPASPNGILRFYQVTYVSDQPGAVPTTVNTTDNSTSLVIDNLEPFTNYSVNIVGVTVDEGQPSEEAIVKTDESGRCSVLAA